MMHEWSLFSFSIHHFLEFWDFQMKLSSVCSSSHVRPRSWTRSTSLCLSSHCTESALGDSRLTERICLYSFRRVFVLFCFFQVRLCGIFGFVCLSVSRSLSHTSFITFQFVSDFSSGCCFTWLLFWDGWRMPARIGSGFFPWHLRFCTN